MARGCRFTLGGRDGVGSIQSLAGLGGQKSFRPRGELRQVKAAGLNLSVTGLCV